MIAQTPMTTQLETHFEWAGALSGWGLLLGTMLLVACGLTVLWLYRQERRSGASRQLRYVLGAVRCAILGGLALIWLEPVMATYRQRTQRARIAVLVDVSSSMRLPDVGGDAAPRRPRIDAAWDLLTRDDSAWLRRLAEKNEPAVFLFGDRVDRVPPSEAQAVPPDQHLFTDLSRACAEVTDALSDAPLAGLIVLSDGAINRGATPAEIAEQAAQSRLPIYTVAVGSSLEPPNGRVVQVSAPPQVSAGDPFTLRATLAASGVTDQQGVVEIRRRKVGATDEQLVQRLDVSLSGEAAQHEVEVKITPGDAGEFTYRVHLTPWPGEPVTTDNEGDVKVAVIDQPTRVLLVAGRPSYDYRFVTRLLERDSSIQVSTWLQSADAQAVRDGDKIITELPRRAEDLFAYDAILLMDPDPRELDAAWAVTLRRYIEEHGGGVLLQAGPHYLARFFDSSALQPLIGILPVSPDSEASILLTEQGAFRSQAEPFSVAAEHLSHPLLGIEGHGSLALTAWESLPGIWWRFPTGPAKPLATVMMTAGKREAGGGAPLLAYQPVGNGRIAYLGFDTTWRWRGSNETLFNRFWIQMVRFLAGARTAGQTARGTLLVDPESVELGGAIRVEARILDSAYIPWMAESTTIQAEFPDGSQRPIELLAIPGREGWYAGRLALDQVGRTTLSLQLPGGPDGPETRLSRHVRAWPSDVEQRTLRMHIEALQELAERTGGRCVALSDADQLPEWIESAHRTPPPELTERRTLWDRWWVLGLLTSALCMEWAVRRWHYLL